MSLKSRFLATNFFFSFESQTLCPQLHLWLKYPPCNAHRRSQKSAMRGGLLRESKAKTKSSPKIGTIFVSKFNWRPKRKKVLTSIGSVKNGELFSIPEQNSVSKVLKLCYVLYSACHWGAIPPPPPPYLRYWTCSLNVMIDDQGNWNNLY